MSKAPKEMVESIESILDAKLMSCAKENAQFGFLSAVALLKHIAIRVPGEAFGPIVNDWVLMNIDQAEQSPLWAKAFALMSNQAEDYLDKIVEDEEDEEGDE